MPPDLDRIVAKALEKDAAMRYQTADDLRVDLLRLARDSDVSLTTTEAPRRVGATPTPAHATLRDPGRVRRSPPRCGGRGRLPPDPGAGLTDRDQVVLADVANLTGDPAFDDTLRAALAVAIQQSPYLNVVPEVRVRETLR